MAKAGSIVISTDLETSEFEKGVDTLVKKAQEAGRKVDKNEINEMWQKTVKDTENKIEELTPYLEKYSKLVEEYFNLTNQSKGTLIFESDKQDAAELKEQIKEVVNQIEKLTGEKISIAGINDAKDNLNIVKANINEVDKSIRNIGKSINSVVKKVVRWGLAVFGIRGAYTAVRNAMSIIIQQDAQLKADIDYMKNAIAYTLEPVVRAIVNLMKQLMFYVAYIVKAWTGKNIFENANKSLKAANGQAKQLKKTLAGFDQLNILNDTSDSSGGSGTASPSFDLSDIENMEVPSWIQWIADNGELVTAIIGGITGALIAMKIFGLDPLMGLGIGLIIMGIILLIQDVIKFIQDPSWDNFAEILKDLAILLMGVVVVMIALNAVNPTTWILLAIALIAALVALIIQNWDKIKEVLGKVGAWIYDHIIKPVGDFFKGLWDGIVNGFNAAIEWIKTTFNNVVNFFKGIINTIVSLFKNIGTKVGDVIGGAFKGVVNGVLSAIENILNFPIRSINTLIGTINNIPGINLGKLSTFKLPRLAKGGIVNMPGRGVDYYGANIGERGAEGIVPMTNEQSLETIGRTIAKYTKFDANVTLELEGRILAKIMKEINADKQFARNGG